MTKKRLSWMAYGNTDLQPTSISPDLCQHIEQQLLATTDLTSIPDQFFCDLERAINFYQGQEEINRTDSPARVYAELKGVTAASTALHQALQALSPMARECIDSNVSDYLARSTTQEMLTRTGAFEGQAIEAENAIAPYCARGKLPKSALHQLAVDIANGLEQHLGIKATTTRNGPFEAVLALVLTAIDQRRAEPHLLVCKAIALKRGANS
ncbi:hypothetical protein SAMN04488540_104122 [Ferrimonas sediminum]|uniref:Uncharacterized protein n=1 Tax=Ferrimonas sediminum TaxID=718193 RepID=A0A1G8PXU3_9GAMM|nr:hypothetical protein [Ferrimonas sediminum]SDI97312.1 hypothetical protein SAMN04488540_104122 [Ferrimonas sediminum]